MVVRRNSRNEKTAMKHVVLLHDSESVLPLFIIPGTGGKTNYFNQLAKLLSGNYKVFGVNFKGTELREKPLNSVEEIASQLILWIRQIQPVGPYRFISHCFGSKIAFEMATRLEKRGEITEFIAIMDGVAGRDRTNRGPGFFSEAMRLIAGYFESFDILKPPYPDWVRLLEQELTYLSIEEIVPHISAVLQKKIPSKKGVIRYVTRLLSINIHHLQIAYTASGKTNSDIYLFKPDLEGFDELGYDETLGWKNHAEKITIVHTPSCHNTMMLGESARIISHHLAIRQIK